MDIEKILFELLDKALSERPIIFKKQAMIIADEVTRHDSRFDSYLTEDLDGYVGEYLFEMSAEIDEALSKLTQE